MSAVRVAGWDEGTESAGTVFWEMSAAEALAEDDGELEKGTSLGAGEGLNLDIAGVGCCCCAGGGEGGDCFLGKGREGRDGPRPATTAEAPRAAGEGRLVGSWVEVEEEMRERRRWARSRASRWSGSRARSARVSASARS